MWHVCQIRNRGSVAARFSAVESVQLDFILRHAASVGAGRGCGKQIGGKKLVAHEGANLFAEHDVADVVRLE